MSEVVNKPKSGGGVVLIASALIAAVVFGTIGFVGGMQYQKSKQPVLSATGLNGQAGFSGDGMNGGFQRRAGGFGTISAISSTSITVKDARTSSETTYSITDTTTVTNNGATTKANDVTVGSTVIVSTSESAPTVATSIAVNPTMPSGGPMGQQPDIQTN